MAQHLACCCCDRTFLLAVSHCSFATAEKSASYKHQRRRHRRGNARQSAVPGDKGQDDAVRRSMKEEEKGQQHRSTRIAAAWREGAVSVRTLALGQQIMRLSILREMSS
jgi:hypothetical protein